MRVAGRRGRGGLGAQREGGREEETELGEGGMRGLGGTWRWWWWEEGGMFGREGGGGYGEGEKLCWGGLSVGGKGTKVGRGRERGARE